MEVIYTRLAEKQLSKLDKTVQKNIRKYMDTISELDDPRSRGHVLHDDLRGLWRYRVDDVRIICQIKDRELIIEVVNIGNRREIYKKKA